MAKKKATTDDWIDALTPGARFSWWDTVPDDIRQDFRRAKERVMANDLPPGVTRSIVAKKLRERHAKYAPSYTTLIRFLKGEFNPEAPHG